MKVPVRQYVILIIIILVGIAVAFRLTASAAAAIPKARSDKNDGNRQITNTASNVVVITFVSYSHREYLLNWMIGAVGSGISSKSVQIICLDGKISAWLSALGKPCKQQLSIETSQNQAWSSRTGRKCEPSYSLIICETEQCCTSACASDPKCNTLHFVENTNSCRLCTTEVSTPSRVGIFFKKNKIQTLFKARIEILLQYIKNGKSVILSDIDAMWIRSPIDYVLASGSDIVSQRGSYPKHLSEKWGATVCMGFTFLRSSRRSEVFLESVFKEVSKVGDDQVAFNTVLDTNEMSWSGPRLTYESSTESSTGLTSSGLVVTLLPHSLFPRVCPPVLASSVVVAHCFDKGVSKKDPTQKMRLAMNRGIWYLKSDWKDAPLGDFEVFLNTISNNSKSSLLL
eukprot:TRINITY_DN27456_c0_g1_i1.p1 TRINITY_DN27456_c0_g1~~TRINITY_DN27456_c0_g1_i1.p1  ORF type:complete len:399 (+),score=64.33 TRINITY_DN27456_c0_g1_i1:91-1287(+)